MNHGACPPREVLRDFAMGNLDETEIDAVAEHLESCCDCESEIAQFDREAGTVLMDLRRRRKGSSGTSTLTDDVGREGRASAADVATRPPEQIDDFQIIKEIGRGGMGVVPTRRSSSRSTGMSRSNCFASPLTARASAVKPGPPAGCTTLTSSRSMALANAMAGTTTSCSTYPAAGSMPSCTS